MQAKRSATVAWSPLNGSRGLVATGTVANAIDDSFETTADLEVELITIVHMGSVYYLSMTHLALNTNLTTELFTGYGC